jgi:hypothetical protein
VTRLEAALAYASWGWPVLPIVPNGKLPATAHGVHDASTDPEQIRKWFEGRDDLNLAIAAGARSGLVVFDIDPRNGGDDSYAEWTAAHGALDAGALQLTAGGGQHFLAAHDPSIRSCKLVDGVDLLADGRYFLAFPSTIEGREYRWEVSSDPFDGVAPASIPEAWRGAMTPTRAPKPVVGAELITGNRNAGLAALAGAMRHHGMTRAEMLAALVVANEERCEIPLPASEVRQIAESIGRYEPEHDTAANAAMADDAVAGLLAKVEAQRTAEYFLTRATSFLTEPAPLRWLVKGWVPEAGVTMVFGESGAGKTFITLDMACRIATGLDWHGRRAKKGVVVYLCGEGNFGFRQRVAAWAKLHGRGDLDTLLVSNKALDLDGPNAAAQILSAVRELTNGDVEAVFVDTVNNHMAGDENSARDVRNMFGACNVVASALNATVVLNHHTGHGIDTKGRARGSSAWKASLDASILIAKGDDGTIEVSCTKMKDAEPPAAFVGRLDSVALGWVDEDGEEVKGAVFVKLEGEVVAPKKPKVDSRLEKHRKTFEGAWWASGAEERAGAPYLSRAALRAYLVEHMGMTEATANQLTKPTATGKLIAELLTAEVITSHEHGWIMTHDEHANALRLAKGGLL